MVSYTPDRTYPYSDPTDPADVPAAISLLARAVDFDMRDLDRELIRRPMAKVRGQQVQEFPSEQATEVVFDFLEVDNANITNLSQEPTRLTPTMPGLWVVFGHIDPAVNTAMTIRTSDVFLRRNGVDLTRYEQHTQPPAGLLRMRMSLAAMAFMNGTTDYFTMTYEPDQASQDQRIVGRSLGCARITSM